MARGSQGCLVMTTTQPTVTLVSAAAAREYAKARAALAPAKRSVTFVGVPTLK